MQEKIPKMVLKTIRITPEQSLLLKKASEKKKYHRPEVSEASIIRELIDKHLKK